MVEHSRSIELSKLESSVEMKMRWVTLCLRCRGDPIAHSLVSSCEANSEKDQKRKARMEVRRPAFLGSARKKLVLD
jgi:hypothetical protein